MNDFKNERDLNSKLLLSESQTSKTCVKLKLTVEMAVNAVTNLIESESQLFYVCKD